jgi:hypothetical protein
MKLTVISLAYDEATGFDAGPLEEFCNTHSVTGWVDHFFLHAGEPRLAVVLEYEERARSQRGSSAPRWFLWVTAPLAPDLRFS